MLQIARWKVTLILLAVLAAIVVTLPNFFSTATVAKWPVWLPHQQVVLGLDLQGGAYLLYEVDKNDYIQKRLRTLLSDVRTAMLQSPRIGYTGLGVQGQGVQLRIRDLSQLDDVRKRLEPLRNPISSGLLSTGGVNEFDLTVNADGLVRLTYSDAGLTARIRGIVSQSIEVINRRINELGTTEPSIQRQGEDRILVEAPGLGDPQRLKDLVGKTAQLTFHLVESQTSAQQAGQTPPQPGTVRYPSASDPSTIYEVDEVPLMTGEDLVDAQAGFDQQTNEPVVNFRLTTGGARKFGDVTAANVGRLFAIVLDDQVISAPSIREPIRGGSGQISGSFTVQSANDLAILLRAGSLPAKLTIVEERSVGPGLGAELDQSRQDRRLDRHHCRRPVHVCRVWLPGDDREPGGRRECRLHHRNHHGDRSDADHAGYRRHRPYGRHGGGFERTHLRADARRITTRSLGHQRDRRGLQTRLRHHC